MRSVLGVLGGIVLRYCVTISFIFVSPILKYQWRQQDQITGSILYCIGIIIAIPSKARQLSDTHCVVDGEIG